MMLLASRKNPCVALIIFLIVNPSQAFIFNPSQAFGGVFIGGMSAAVNVGSGWKNNRGCVRLLSSFGTGETLSSLFAEILAPVENQKFEALAHANPEKIVAVVGLFVSSCLLYHSVLLSRDISQFYGKFKELRGEFDEFLDYQLPKIQRLAERLQDGIDGKTGVADANEQQRMMLDVLVFYSETVRVLGRVRGLIKEAMKTQEEASAMAAFSFTVAAIAAIALLPLSPVVSIADGVARLGIGVTGGLGAAAGAMSLMNVHHCKLALREMRNYEEQLEALRSYVLYMTTQSVFEKEARYEWWSFWLSVQDDF